jgi:hypothetical protein
MGVNRVRLCIQAGTTRAEIDALVSASVAWAGGIRLDKELGSEGDRTLIEGKVKWNEPEQGLVAFVWLRLVKDGTLDFDLI